VAKVGGASVDWSRVYYFVMCDLWFGLSADKNLGVCCRDTRTAVWTVPVRDTAADCFESTSLTFPGKRKLGKVLHDKVGFLINTELFRAPKLPNVPK